MKIEMQDGTKGLRVTQSLALIIALIGPVNWGLIGIFNVDMVALLCGDKHYLARAI